MHLKVKIAENETRIHTGDLDDSMATWMTLGDRRYHVRITPISHHRMNLEIDGRNHAFSVAANRDGSWVWVDGRTRLVRPAGDVAALVEASTTMRRGPRGVSAPTPATVVQILVSKGDLVEKGQEMAVVSAMKMESTLTAPAAGRVAAIHCNVGDVVSAGDMMIEIAGPEDETLDDPDNA